MKKILYFGGQKSGKSTLAEKKTIEISNNNMPYYIATYDNSYGDTEMLERLTKHQDVRVGKFITIEEIKELNEVVKEGETYLVDCLSMWIMNHLEDDEGTMLAQLDKLAKIDANIVFVLNDVTSGVIPVDSTTRKFVDMTGIVGQKVVSFCDEVYEVKFGLEKRLK